MSNLLEIPIHLNTNRKILHIDMDAFYAQIEMRDNPDYKSVPLILANDPRKTVCLVVLATGEYLTSNIVVHSEMSVAEALTVSMLAIFVTLYFSKDRNVSHQLHQIFKRYINKIEPVAFNEAYLDFT